MSGGVAHTVEQRILVACGRGRKATNLARGCVNELRGIQARLQAVVSPSVMLAMKEALAELQAAHMTVFAELNEIASEFTGGHPLPAQVKAQDMPLHPANHNSDEDGLLPGAKRWKDNEVYRDPRLLQANDHTLDGEDDQ